MEYKILENKINGDILSINDKYFEKNIQNIIEKEFDSHSCGSLCTHNDIEEYNKKKILCINIMKTFFIDFVSEFENISTKLKDEHNKKIKNITEYYTDIIDVHKFENSCLRKVNDALMSNKYREIEENQSYILFNTVK